MHPDQNTAAFTPDAGWCQACRKTIRNAGTRWYGSHGAGPYCTAECMRAEDKQGSLPGFVSETIPSPLPLHRDFPLAPDKS